MYKRFLPLLFLFTAFQTNADIIRSFDFSGFNGDSHLFNEHLFDDLIVTFNFDDGVDLYNITQADISSWHWSSSHINATGQITDSAGSLFSFDGVVLSLTIGQTGLGAYLWDDVNGLQLGQDNRHSIYYRPSGEHAKNFAHTVVAEYASVPEPSIIALFGAGLVGLGFARRRKSRQA